MNFYKEVKQPMTWLDGSRIFTVCASLFITGGLYLQVVKIFRTRSARDFSSVLIAAMVFNEAAWLNYGFLLGEWPIIVISACNLPAVIACAYGYRKFSRTIDERRTGRC